MLSYKYELIGTSVMLPVCWYSLIDEEGEIHRMLFFENQMSGLLSMMNDKKSWIDKPEFTVKDAIRKYFNDFCEQPLEYELQLFMDNNRYNDYPPQRFAMKNRKTIDPLYVIDTAEREGKELYTYAGEIYDEYPMTADIYGSKENYLKKIADVKIYKEKNVVIGQDVQELPEELIEFDRTPIYNIDELVQEVKIEMFDGSYDGLGLISWTDKPCRTYFGIHHNESHDIEINCVLNSKDVPKEVVKFVIYHEMLHRDNIHHNKEFYELEHKYPNYAEYDHFLDEHMKKFDIKEW